MRKKVLIALAVSAICTGGALTDARVYTLDGIEVEADREYDRFGNTITEQSYYRTGGDVNVITSAEIEKRHYAQLGDALKYLPGVQVQTPGGYRGGEYGYTQTHSIVTINGDARVVILIDGRRMDNESGSPIASNSGSGSKAMVDVNQMISMDNIDKIEVIKGPGASIYGADATGGVINIITKKGAMKPVGTIDLSTGSWDRHNYKLSYSGSNADGKFRYFLSAGREMGGDSKYKDGLTGKKRTWKNTGYKDENVNVRLDYNWDETHSLTASYNHMNADDDYPLTAPDYRYMDAENWKRIMDDYFYNDKYGNTNNPGYRNLWYMWAWTGAYNAYNKNNLDVTYRFGKNHGMESFVRFYNQTESYWGSFGGGDDENAPTPGSAEWYTWAKENYRGRDYKAWYHHQENRGVQFQYGKSVGIHDLLTTWTFDKSKYYSMATKTGLKSWVKRDSVLGYVQDKIHVTDRWEITPSIRYAHYSDFTKVARDGTTSNAGKSVNSFTPSINTQYAFNDSMSMYAGYSKVYRPLRVGDYTRTNSSGGVSSTAGLKDERGDVWTIGLRKNFSEKTSASIHYDYTDMSNAVARYSVWDKNAQDFNLKYVNAKETKKSINLSASHRFDKHWNLNLNYSHATDKWSAKDGMTFDPDLTWVDGNVNSAINKFRPANTYTAVLSYENDKLYVSLLGNYYTGMNRLAYTTKRALILDLSVNYDITSDIAVYGTVSNLTDKAWENTYTTYLGMGSWPQPGRAFMLGARYKF